MPDTARSLPSLLGSVDVFARRRGIESLLSKGKFRGGVRGYICSLIFYLDYAVELTVGEEKKLAIAKELSEALPLPPDYLSLEDGKLLTSLFEKLNDAEFLAFMLHPLPLAARLLFEEVCENSRIGLRNFQEKGKECVLVTVILQTFHSDLAELYALHKYGAKSVCL